MSRASWGGQADLSGLFSSLINEDFNAIKAGINEALGDAQNEQAAQDQKMQARWTAGKINDEQWLDYIRSRIQDSTDPEERSQWQQILLQNQDAISDAQWETRFQQDKITVGQLMAHYRVRMAEVRRNSPAYRDLVSRNTELIQFRRSGGVHYSDQWAGSGGGGGGGGGGGSSSGYGSGGSGGGDGRGSLQSIITKGLKGGPTDVGYMGGDVFNTRGPNVVGVNFGRPATGSMSSLFVAVQDGLTGSQKQLDAFFDFLEQNPKATSYTIPGTGQLMQINAKTVRAADEQWMRVTQTMVDVAVKKGDFSEANYQEGLLGNHVTYTMRNHNAMFNQPNEDMLGAWTKRIWARLGAAATPEERMRIATEAGQQMDQYMERHYPESVIVRRESTMSLLKNTEAQPDVTKATTLEEQLPPEVYAAHTGLRQMIDIVANPQNYTDEDIDTIFDSAYDLEDIGTGGSRVHIADLMGGPSGEYASTLGEGALGAGDFRAQFFGLQASDYLQRGIATPDDVAGIELYTYQWNSANNRMEPTLALAVPEPDGSFDVMPAVSDSSGNLTPAINATRYMTSVNGKQTEVWTPVIDAAPASGYVYRTGVSMVLDADGKKVSFPEGSLVPSSVLAKLGAFQLNQYVTAGTFYKDAPPGVRQADIGGKTWYFDARVNTWSPVPPWDIESDATDPNAIYVVDPDYARADNGGYTVDSSKVQAEQVYISMDLTPGVTGYVLPFDTSMDPRQMQNWLEEQIATGKIIPEEYLAVDAEGQAVTLSQDDLMTMYFDPALAARADTLRKQRIAISTRTGAGLVENYNQERGAIDTSAAAIQQAVKQGAAIENYEKNFSPYNMGGTPPPVQSQADLDADRMRQIEQIAMNLGVRTGVTPKPSVQIDQPKRLDDSTLRIAAMTAARQREGIARQPRLEPLPPPKPKPVLKPIVREPLERADPVAPLRGVSPGLTAAQRRAIERMQNAGRATAGRGFTPGLA